MIILNELEKIFHKLIEDQYNYYDHYDPWSGRFGIFLKDKKYLTPVTGLLYLADMYFPSAVRIFFQKSVPTEILPWLIHGLIFLANETNKSNYTDEARRLYSFMIEHLGASSDGMGLGLQFNWHQSIPAFSPCVSLTSYAADIIFEMNEKKISDKNPEPLLSAIGSFVYNNLNYQELSGDAGRHTYTEGDNLHVINANSYGARIMRQLGNFFDNDKYRLRSGKLLNYIISEQNDDGSWYYYDKQSHPMKENFIDSFHTAYILENLSCLYHLDPNDRLRLAITKGLKFYFDKFINDNYSINHSYISNLPVKITADIRCNAEAINLLSILSDHNNDFLDYAGKILDYTMKKMYDRDNNYFYFRRFRFRLSKMNYPRWGTGPMVNAITNYLYASKKARGIT